MSYILDDGFLQNKEFIAVMKDKMIRGLNKVAKKFWITPKQYGLQKYLTQDVPFRIILEYASK